MSKIDFDLTKIKTFVFDIDGVLSAQSISMSPDGEPMRTINLHDGYAINIAVKSGYGVAIITGGDSQAVHKRYSALGVKHIYMKSSIKINDFKHLLKNTDYKAEEMVYVGDDIPDYEVMQQVALPIAPADAAPEIKNISKYISPKKGGDGVARDIIEQVLRAQGNWMHKEAFGW